MFKPKFKVLALFSLVAAINWADIIEAGRRTSNTLEESPFKIIIDGGSTGSRLHIFEFTTDENGVEQCVRRGSSRANIPLSAFGRLPSEKGMNLNATKVAAHMIPLFVYAADVIPQQYHYSTQVQYAATAGMRLLDDDEQKAVFDALYKGLMESDSFVFKSSNRENIATLSGELEGFYGAIAANYLKGIIDTRLHVAGETDDSGPIGALDMGGSSTQIVFLPGSEPKEIEEPTSCPSSFSSDKSCPADMPSPSKLNGDHFFSTSYLSYGVDQFRERLWTTLVNEQRAEADETPDSCVSKFVPNPCANKGYTVEWLGFTLIGTGDTQECIRQTQRLIPHPEMPHDDHNKVEMQVGGVEHPPVKGKFLAMSLYFFSLDSLRVFSKPNDEAHKALNQAWPNPSIQELHDALDGLCSRSWADDMALQKDAHSYTREEVLPHRCIETVYMVSLLKYGFGFHPSSRDITFTFLVDGSEVEWTLGMALSMNAEKDALDDGKEKKPSINRTSENEECEGDEPIEIPGEATSSLYIASSLRVLKSYLPAYFEN